ncbi:unnamed protein product [Brachionus calyciflorus]|uniref:Uncharacterized protein n=1 Tax=Brachionus calyciflorus TaxID=104777 RepID=A0A813P0M0_9BILA|nr:unnamed protein product [Brachionus calyciflorus]
MLKSFLVCISIVFPLSIIVCQKTDLQNESVSLEEFNQFKTDKLNDYFQYFKSELKPQEMKKFYLKLIQLESDIDNLVTSSIFHSDDSLKEFIDTNLRIIHKNLFFEKNIDLFLNEVKDKYNFILSTNAVDKNMIKSRDWRQKDNNFKKSQYLENFEYDREKLGLDKNSKAMFKSKTEKNSELMNRKFNDIGHKFFNDDLFESDDDNHLSDFL